MSRCFQVQEYGAVGTEIQDGLARNPSQPCGLIRDIRFENIECDSENGILVYALSPGHLEELVFARIRIRLSVKSKWFDSGYDLRPGYRSGIIRKAPVAFMIHNAKEVLRSDVTVVNELVEQDSKQA